MFSYSYKIESRCSHQIFILILIILIVLCSLINSKCITNYPFLIQLLITTIFPINICSLRNSYLTFLYFLKNSLFMYQNLIHHYLHLSHIYILYIYLHLFIFIRLKYLIFFTYLL